MANGIKLVTDLQFVCAQPATDYYVWQVEVMLNNFVKNGINLNNVDIVCWKVNGVVPDNWQTLANNYAARFFFYDDTRVSKHYISSIRPNILKQHFTVRTELIGKSIFYHDCDIIFSKPIDWSQFLAINDFNWYGSDTRWYIGHDYILSKGVDILDAMCEIVDISKNIIEENEKNAIGAQYLMKGITAEFWENVEKDCEKLFHDITQLNNQKKMIDPSYHELQIWCADMWAVLWNGWKLGYKTVCSPELEFSWGTSSEEDYHKMNIMHNAGVTNSGELFYKAEYINELPYGKDLQIKENTASWHYYQAIKDAEKNTKLI
jgi:hypothetical protein